jgi:LysR family transcriptional regulator for metE and metH
MKRMATPPPLPRIDVRDLQVVLALASAGSTGGAGAALGLTQSAVSRALRLAEDKLGARLFERTARGLAPTPAGQRLIAGAGPVLAQLAALEDAARAPVQPPTRVRLVGECYTAYRWLPSALARLREQRASLDVRLAVEHTYDPAGALQAGLVDVALLTTSAVGGGIRERPLFADEVVFVVGAAHPLAARPALTAADLRAHPIITGKTPAAEMAWFMSRVFGRQRPKLDVLRLPLTEAIVDAARAGLGIAVLSEWIAAGYLNGADLVAKRFAARPLMRAWRIAFRDDFAGVARWLAAALEGSAPRLYANLGPAGR